MRRRLLVAVLALGLAAGLGVLMVRDPGYLGFAYGGWLFESSNADAFHAQLRAALDARNEWPAYQERGRQLVEAEFAVEKIARRYLTLYEELIATPVTHRHPAK